MELKNIKDPSFVKSLNTAQLEQLAEDIREFIIDNISKTGGHFSSNLGIVELTIALHYVFNSPNDKILFDVGHQSYIHKILTGRAKEFNTLRQYNGLSGFQKRKESIHDSWEAGHSSTALSGAIGMAVARDLDHQNYEVIPVVGDGALLSGETFEAMNYLGSIDSKVILILNDNNMSICKNVGGFSNLLNEIRVSSPYNHARSSYIHLLNNSQIGKNIYKFTKKIKDRIKENVLNENIFSQFGLDYIGPIDGHNFDELINALSHAKSLDHSVVVHVHTTKGKGYEFAENDIQGVYHGVSPFDKEKGVIVKESNVKSWSEICSTQVHKYMGYDKDVVVITPAMISGSCLHPLFERYKDRCFDVGIAEEHAMTFAAGLSNNGKKPYITIYSSFIQRAYDQINHDIARMNLPCLIGIDRAGLVGADGETHHGVFDISFLSAIPHIIIMTPKDAKEAKQMINTAFYRNDAPYVLRFPRGSILDHDVDINEYIEIGKWKKIIYDSSKKVTVITYDEKVNKVINMINEKNLNINIINARFIKPMDYELLNELYHDHQKLIIYETDLLIGSLGSMICHYYMNNKMNMNITCIGINDRFTPQGSMNELLDHENININDLYNKIKEIECEKRKS